ncbi:MAG: glycosyltransferase family 61 protein, partial [Bacteroidota bacterium]
QKEQLSENAVVLPRWDKVLQRTSFFLFWPSRLHTDFPFKSTKKYKDIRKGLFRNLWSGYLLRRSVLQMRRLLIDKVGVENVDETAEYLLIKRSEMPSFYAADGGAKKKGYGVFRRSFQDLDAGQNTLSQDGIAAKIFEPGKHTLSKQVKKFNAAKGVVAVRGADLVNIIWLRPGTRVFMINTKNNPPFHFYNLAAILGLKLVERCTYSHFPAFQDLQISELIETYG